ncbi:hypothetical protein C8R42DRAFT_642906 [Lentinula raphanica]|nr:hypothetical protein C8R42DRAFT_642906 [Lentinula raphanica]
MSIVIFPRSGPTEAKVHSQQLSGTKIACLQYWFRKRREQLIAELYNPIYFLELDRTATQLLVCSGSRTTLLVERKAGQWKLRSHFDSPSSFAEMAELGEPDGFEEPQVLATSAHFLDEKGLIVVGYLHHGLWKYQTESGTSTLVWGPDEKIGSTALSPDGTALVATNIRSGLDWFRVTTNAKWKKISSSPEIQDSNSNIPLPVCFIDKGKHVIMGTSKGYAAIFHTKHGKKIVSLDHGHDKTWVTALAFCHPPNKLQLIATGDGNCGVDTRIKVWITDADSTNTTSFFKDWSLLLLRFLMRVSYHVLAIGGLTFIVFRLTPANHVENFQQSFATFLVKSVASQGMPAKHVDDIRQSFSTLLAKSPIPQPSPTPERISSSLAQSLSPLLEQSLPHTPRTWRPRTRTLESFAQRLSSANKKMPLSSITVSSKVWIASATDLSEISTTDVSHSTSTADSSSGTSAADSSSTASAADSSSTASAADSSSTASAADSSSTASVTGSSSAASATDFDSAAFATDFGSASSATDFVSASSATDFGIAVSATDFSSAASATDSDTTHRSSESGIWNQIFDL